MRRAIEAYEANPFFADQRGSRTAPAGTVARGWLREDEALYTGKVNGQVVDTLPLCDRACRAETRTGAVQHLLLAVPRPSRRRQRHGGAARPASGGVVSQRSAAAGKTRYFFDVITNGFGAMQGYADQVPVRDRWLIVAYVRALQLSQNAKVNDVPAERRTRVGQRTGSGEREPRSGEALT